MARRELGGFFCPGSDLNLSFGTPYLSSTYLLKVKHPELIEFKLVVTQGKFGAPAKEGLPRKLGASRSRWKLTAACFRRGEGWGPARDARSRAGPRRKHHKTSIYAY